MDNQIKPIDKKDTMTFSTVMFQNQQQQKQILKLKTEIEEQQKVIQQLKNKVEVNTDSRQSMNKAISTSHPYINKSLNQSRSDKKYLDSMRMKQEYDYHLNKIIRGITNTTGKSPKTKKYTDYRNLNRNESNFDRNLYTKLHNDNSGISVRQNQSHV